MGDKGSWDSVVCAGCGLTGWLVESADADFKVDERWTSLSDLYVPSWAVSNLNSKKLLVSTGDFIDS